MKNWTSFAIVLKNGLKRNCKTLASGSCADILRDNVSRIFEDFVNRDYKPPFLLYKYSWLCPLISLARFVFLFQPLNVVFIAGKEGFVRRDGLIWTMNHSYLSELQTSASYSFAS